MSEGSFLKRVEIPRMNLVGDIFLKELATAEADKKEPLQDMLKLVLISLI